MQVLNITGKEDYNQHARLDNPGALKQNHTEGPALMVDGGFFPKPHSIISPAVIKWALFLRELINQTSISSLLEECLDLIASLEVTQPGAEKNSLIAELRVLISGFQAVIQRQELNASNVRDQIMLYTASEKLKTGLMSNPILSDTGPAASLLKQKIVDIVTYLDAVKFLNLEGLNNTNIFQPLLYFPLSVFLGNQKIKTSELLIHPESDPHGVMSAHSISFTLFVETEYFGQVTIQIAMRNRSIHCEVNVDNETARDIFIGYRDMLSYQLKNKRFLLSSFSCTVKKGVAQPITVPQAHLEMCA